MLAYIGLRILSTIPVMAIVALFVFSLLYIAPGDPAAIIAGDQASPADIVRILLQDHEDERLYVVGAAAGLEAAKAWASEKYGVKAWAKDPFGSLSGGVLLTLNTSARNSRLIRSVNRKVLPIIRSAF